MTARRALAAGALWGLLGAVEVVAMLARAAVRGWEAWP